MTFNTTFKGGLIAAISSAIIALGGTAQAEYPEKPVDMTVLFGGTAKPMAQLLSEWMGGARDEPVVPVRRTGGGGAVGYSHVVGTTPDGYNIVWNSNSISTTHHTGRVEFDYSAFTHPSHVCRQRFRHLLSMPPRAGPILTSLPQA